MSSIDRAIDVQMPGSGPDERERRRRMDAAAPALPGTGMRIAWLGPVGEVGGGPSLGLLLLESVLRQGVAVDYFTGDGKLPASLDGFANLSVVTVSGWWQWGRWYSRRQMAAFVSGAFARA